MSIQVKRIGKQEYKYEVTWDEKEKKQRWRYIGKVTNDPEHVDNLSNSRWKTLFFFSLVAIFTAGFFVHPHPYFVWDEHPAFHAIYGFVICVIIVLGSRTLGHMLRREDDYYD